MSFVFESILQQLSLLSNPGEAQADTTIRCTHNASGAAFPRGAAKIAVINVDTAGRELLLSGQEGICVQ
jgi:hypothetical protein